MDDPLRALCDAVADTWGLPAVNGSDRLLVELELDSVQLYELLTIVEDLLDLSPGTSDVVAVDASTTLHDLVEELKRHRR